MNTQNFLHHLELLYEERLVEKISLNIKIIEVNSVDCKTKKNIVSGCLRDLWPTDCPKCCAIALEDFDPDRLLQLLWHQF